MTEEEVEEGGVDVKQEVVAEAPKKKIKRRRKKKTAGYASDDDLAAIGNLKVYDKIRQEREKTKRGRKANLGDGDSPSKGVVSLEEKLLQGPYILPESDSFSLVNPTAKLDAASGVSIRPNVVWPQQDQMSKSARWVCVFCGRGVSLESRMGPLYGPYFITPVWLSCCADHGIPADLVAVTPGDDLADKPAGQSARGKPKKSADKAGKSRTAEISRLTLSGEYWTHLDCLLWCPGAVFDGFSISDISDTLLDSFKRSCSSCQLAGAALRCAFHGCSKSFHFPCARELGCQFDSESFSLLCDQHKSS